MNLRPLYLAIGLLDIIAAFYLGWLALKVACLTLYAQLISLYTTNSIYRQLNGIAQRRLVPRKVPPASFDPWIVPYRLWRYRREHGRLTEYILRSDTPYWSAGLFNFFVHNIPLNVYVVQYLAHQNADQTMRLLSLYILLIQLWAIALSMFPAVQASTRLYASQRYMCALQGKRDIHSTSLAQAQVHDISRTGEYGQSNWLSHWTTFHH